MSSEQETAMYDQPDDEQTMLDARDEYMAGTGNFSSVQVAVEHAFVAGWEAALCLTPEEVNK